MNKGKLLIDRRSVFISRKKFELKKIFFSFSSSSEILLLFQRHFKERISFLLKIFFSLSQLKIFKSFLVLLIKSNAPAAPIVSFALLRRIHNLKEVEERNESLLSEIFCE